MQSINNLKRRIGQIYLSLVPFLVLAFALGVGYISYKIYLPIWIINVCLMLTASWFLGLNVIRNHDVEKKHLSAAAFFLIIPWILISMFFGLGPPPQTPTGCGSNGDGTRDKIYNVGYCRSVYSCWIWSIKRTIEKY